MATWSDLFDNVLTDSADNGSVIGLKDFMEDNGPAPRITLFTQFILLSSDQLRAIMLTQAYTDYQIQDFAGYVNTKSNAVAATTEDAKWVEFKSLWSAGSQPAIQVIIDNEINLGTSFATFKARSTNTHATNILALTTSPYDLLIVPKIQL
jgi:hypothetical protein